MTPSFVFRFEKELFAHVNVLEGPETRVVFLGFDQERPELPFTAGDGTQLPFGDDQFDVVVAAEVLEHLPDPEGGLAELARVGRRHLLLSVPQEPIFRGCNLLAGRYLRDWGNTPGHVNHWSKRGFVRFVGQVGQVRQLACRLGCHRRRLHGARHLVRHGYLQ